MDDKRQRILMATLDLIHERGLQSTPMSAIAKEAGVAMGTIYHNFSSKEELVAALYQEVYDQFGRQALDGYTADAPVRARFTQIWSATAQFVLENPKLFLFVNQHAYSPYIDPAAKVDNSGWLATLHQIFIDGQEQGIIKQLDVEVLLYTTVGILSELMKGHISGTLVLDEAAVDTAIDLCWDAIKR